MAKGRKVKKRNVAISNDGIAYIQATFNNIIISICNNQGHVISWGSAGRAGFKGSKKRRV